MLYKIQQLPASERPREKMLQHGPESLSGGELLAILLGTGTRAMPVLDLVQRLLSHFGCLQQVSEATIEELCQIEGIGLVKAVQLKAAFSLGLRLSKVGSQGKYPGKYKIEHPVHAYNFVKDAFQLEKQEQFVVILQNSKGFALGQHTIGMGSLAQVAVHPREVFYPAIRHKAHAIIAVHNHPSGDTTPSKADFDLTLRLMEAGKLMGIPLNDHLIIAENGYYSFRQSSGLFQHNP